jgi:hypothetical protein
MELAQVDRQVGGGHGGTAVSAAASTHCWPSMEGAEDAEEDAEDPDYGYVDSERSGDSSDRTYSDLDDSLNDSEPYTRVSEDFEEHQYTVRPPPADMEPEPNTEPQAPAPASAPESAQPPSHQGEGATDEDATCFGQPAPVGPAGGV